MTRMNIKTAKALMLGILALSLLITSSASGQSNSAFNQRDDEYRLLGLKRARQAFDIANSELQRQQELYNRNLINRAELERAQSVFSGAEVNYQQSLLAVLFERQYVTVTSAVKYQADDNTKHVRLTLANTSGGSAEFKHLLNMEDDLFQSLKPEVVHNVYASLVNENGAIISQPYEIKIEELRYGEPQTVDFAMLQDLDVVTVYLIYSNGTERSFKIFLQKDESVNRVIVQSEQFSQEVNLGQTAKFDLTLEQFSRSRDTYSLQVVNLPRQIARSFTDPAGRVRLTQLKFTESSQSKRAVLEVTLPDRPTDEVTMGQTIEFFALVIPRGRLAEFPDLKSKHWTEQEIIALDIGYVRLELAPRGQGEILVRAPLLFKSISAGEIVTLEFELFNEGSLRIDNIAFDVELPLRWGKTLSPDLIQSLEIGADRRVTLTLSPPEDVTEGRYDIRLRTDAMSNNQPVTGEDKTFTIEVRSETNVLGASLIVMLLLGLVGGIVIFGVKLSRNSKNIQEVYSLERKETQMNDYNGKPLLEAINLTKRYEDGVLALDHISFEVQAGEIFAMLGGNGAGKTTAINLFLNFIEPTDGEARICGITTHQEPLEAKRLVSFVSENVMLYQNFTALQNLDFFARLGGKTDYTRDDYHEALLRVGLAEESHAKKLKGYSKGMRQKCGIAIAILKDSPAILLDEPTSGLDPKLVANF